MTESQQIEVDRVMIKEHNANRSSVTKEQWLDCGNGCSICAYVYRGTTEKSSSRLFMVHFYGHEEFPEGGLIVVYRATAPAVPISKYKGVK